MEIAVRRARLRLNAGRPDLGLEVLDEGLKSAPAGAPPGLGALLLRAEILGALERPAEARAAYEEVRQREPKSPVALAGIAKSMLEEGKHAEAAEFLRTAIPQAPPQESLYLLLAEAEGGLGHLDLAVDAVKKGVEVLPKSILLWVRLGELGIARQSWTDASNAFAHALALGPSSVAVLLRAGFVAERLGHPNEALALYDRATEADPSDKQAWTSRGLALVATGRPTEGVTSFDRALALDSDYAPAKDGKKVATQKTRDAEIQRYGREALLLEARLNRTVAKNDLFVTLHVPYEFLEPVLNAIGRTSKIDLDRLDATEVRDLENASYHLVTSALEHRPPGIERRGFTLADVAVLAPPSYSLDQIERVFGYLKAVLEADLRPENLALTPDVEALARQALVLPPEQRTLFQIVRNLRVGVYKARLIKVVEEAGAAVHAPLPALDLGAYSPEFRSPEGAGPPSTEGPYSAGEVPLAPSGAGETGVSAAPGMASDWAATPEGTGLAPSAIASTGAQVPRCVGCGGIASVVHSCSAPLCQHCIGQFPNCPKCGLAVTTLTTQPLDGVTVHTTRSHVPTRAGSAFGSLKGVFQRAKASPPRSEPVVAKAAPARTEHSPKPGHPVVERPKPAAAPNPPTHREAPTPSPKGAEPDTKPLSEPPLPPASTATRPKREKRDDEPRL